MSRTIKRTEKEYWRIGHTIEERTVEREYVDPYNNPGFAGHRSHWCPKCDALIQILIPQDKFCSMCGTPIDLTQTYEFISQKKEELSDKIHKEFREASFAR